MTKAAVTTDRFIPVQQRVGWDMLWLASEMKIFEESIIGKRRLGMG